MKKKLTISVADLLNKNASEEPMTSCHVKPLHASNQPVNIIQSHSKPLSFEEMYMQAMKKGNPNTGQCWSKKTTPMNTQRIKKKLLTGLSSNNSRKTNKTTGQRFLNPNSNQTSLTQSAKQTPEARSRKNSINSIVMNKENHRLDLNECNDQVWQETKTVLTTQVPSRRDLGERPQSRVLAQFDSIVKEQLNHENHSHLRKDECFLNQFEISQIIHKLGYDPSHPLYREFLSLLEVDVYGGSPSLNLRKLISIIQGIKEILQTQKEEPILPKKIIDNNLQLIVNQKQQEAIEKYFFEFKDTRECQMKISSEKKKRGSKSKMHLPISELVGHFSSGKKEFESSQKELGISRNLEQDADTFRRRSDIESNSARSWSSEKKVLGGDLENSSARNSDDEGSTEDIVALKNRLNQALKKSSNIASELAAMSEGQEEFVSPTPFLKYGTKPILSVDVNLGEGISEKIIVYEGETAKAVSERLAGKFTISLETKLKFEKMLESHLSTMLWKIDELSEQMLTDRDLD